MRKTKREELAVGDETRHVTGGKIVGICLEECRLDGCTLTDCTGRRNTWTAHDTEATTARLRANAETIATLQTENARLNNKGIELALEVERLQTNNETLYRSNETLLELELNAGNKANAETIVLLQEEVRCQKATVEVHLNTLQAESQKVRERDAIIAAGKTERQELSNRLRSAMDRNAGYSTDLAAFRVLLAATEMRLRERDMVIAGYRTSLTEEIDEDITGKEAGQCD